MEDEVLESGQEQNLTQEDFDLGGETVDNEINSEFTEEITEEREFDPANLDLNIESDVGGYDFTKFKDDFNLENEDNLRTLEYMTERYKELGLTQEQFEGLMNMELEYRNSLIDPKKIQENLVKSLNYEEKVNYKANCNILKNALEKTGQGALYKTLTADPISMKIVNALINNLGGGRNVNGIKQRETRTGGRLLSGKQAVDTLNAYILNDGTNIEGKIKEIEGRLANKEAMEFFRSVVNE